MKKYDMGEVITSLEELAKQDAVYLFVRGGKNEHWKYQYRGWFLSFQFNYVIKKLAKGDFRYAIKKEVKNEKV